MIGCEEFTSSVDSIRKFYDWWFNVMEVMNMGESHPTVEATMDAYVQLLLGEVPDEVYEYFWNEIIFSRETTENDIRVFYEDLVKGRYKN